MSDHSLNINKSLLDMNEAARCFNITASSFYKLLKRHPEINKKYVRLIRCEGDKRKRQYISKEGMVVLGNLKESFKGNRYKTVVTTNEENNGKMSLTEKAMAYDNLMQYLPTLVKKIDYLEKHLIQTERIEIPLLAEKPREITTRAKINQMVRRYSKENLIPHNLVWGKLYTQLYYRYQYNAQIRSKNNGMPTLDCVHHDGQMENLFKIAFELLT